MKRSQIKFGSLLSYLQMAAGVTINLVYTPVMIRLLGQNEYGLYNTVASTISMLSILSLGFNSGYIRYYAIYKKKQDNLAISQLNGLYLIIFSIVGIVAFLSGLFLTLHLDLVFDQGLTAREYETARVLMFLLTVNLTASFPMSVFSNIISAHENFIFLKLVGIVKTVFSPLLALPLLLAGYRSIAMVSVTVLFSLIADVLYFGYVVFVMKEKFRFYDFKKGVFKSLFTYTIFIAMNTVIDQINWNVDKFLLGRFKGTAIVAIYSVGYTLYQCYQMFSSSVSNVFTPRIHRIVNATVDNINSQKKELTELLVKVGRIQFLILGLIASGVVFFGQYFIVKIWAGEGYEQSYYVALLLMLPASIALIQNLGIEIQRAENRHRFRSIVYLIMAMINLFLSIVLCQLYGAVGSAIGTALSLIVANGFIMNIYYHKKCNIDILAFWKNIIKMSTGFIIPVLYGIIILTMVEIKSVFQFFFFVFTYTVIYCASMWILGMNRYEKDLVLKPVKKILGRLRRNASH